MPIVIEIGGVVDVDLRQRAHVVGVGERLADGDVLEARDGDDVAGAGALGRVALERPGLEQLGDADAADGAVGAHPRDGLALLERAVEDAQQREAAEERGGVEVRDPRLQRRLVVVDGRRDVLEDRLEERLEVVVVRQAPFSGWFGMPRRRDRCVHDGHVEDRVEVEVGHVVVQVAREAEQQVVRSRRRPRRCARRGGRSC